MTCAKVVVRATLTTRAGNKYHGENRCNCPQPTCPREPGEGYDKCWLICDQPYHAEGEAIKLANEKNDPVEGAHMVVYHKKICEYCRWSMESLGITYETKV